MPLLLREALSNLISNAVKYTPENGEISVWAERGREPHTIVLGVRDTGIGLSQRTRPSCSPSFSAAPIRGFSASAARAWAWR